MTAEGYTVVYPKRYVIEWTPELRARVKEMFLSGKSYTQIAIELGLTRNAVAGNLNRARVLRNGGAVKGTRSYQQKIKKLARAFRPREWQQLGVEATDLPADHPDNPTTFTALSDNHCRWPCSGEGIGVVFCGGQVVAKQSYCARHCQMAYEPPRRRTA